MDSQSWPRNSWFHRFTPWSFSDALNMVHLNISWKNASVLKSGGCWFFFVVGSKHFQFRTSPKGSLKMFKSTWKYKWPTFFEPTQAGTLTKNHMAKFPEIIHGFPPNNWRPWTQATFWNAFGKNRAFCWEIRQGSSINIDQKSWNKTLQFDKIPDKIDKFQISKHYIW